MQESFDSLKDWVGRSETMAGEVTAAEFASLSATLDRSPETPEPGTPLPPLWHWLYCIPLFRASDIEADGHGRRGKFLPPVPLPRRMWAGSQLSWTGPLRVGDAIQRVSTIEEVTPKQGKSGTLVFVRVRHRIERDGQALISEFQDIVYREAPRADATPPAPRLAPPAAAWRREWRPDDVLLFRYSALTFNAHRIHFDRRYVTEVEGYPGLIVHGPLTATLLLDLLRWERPEAHVVSFEFRALRPLFDGRPLHVCGEPLPDGKSIHLWAQDEQGWLATDATAVIR